MSQIILGVNSAYHEPDACLIVCGNIVAVCEEERFNRRCHGKRARVDNADELPDRAIATFQRSSMDALQIGPYLVINPT